MMRPKIWVAQTVVVVMLLLALFGGMDGGFWELLRIVVAIGFLWIGYSFLEQKQIRWLIVCGAIVVLFNPIAPFYLGRPLWVIVDVITGAIAIYSIYVLNNAANSNQQ